MHSILLQSAPVWGHAIKKVECANHACKCYRAGLEKLVLDNPSYKGKGGLTQKMRKRLTSAARCAIKMRSKETDKHKGLRSLERDLINGPFHCFGHHARCSPDFCSTAREKLHLTTLKQSEESDVCSEEESSSDDTDIMGKKCCFTERKQI